MCLLARYKAWQIWWCSVIILPVWGYIQWCAFCFQVVPRVTVWRDLEAKKGEIEVYTIAGLSGKGEMTGKVGAEGLEQEKVKFMLLRQGSKRWKERRAVAMCMHGMKIPLAHLSVYLCTHRFSWMPWDPSLLLGIWAKLISVKDGPSLEYIQIPGTLAGVTLRYWADLMLSSLLKWASTESWGGQVIYYFGHWPLSQLPLPTVFATGRLSVAFQEV